MILGLLLLQIELAVLHDNEWKPIHTNQYPKVEKNNIILPQWFLFSIYAPAAPPTYTQTQNVLQICPSVTDPDPRTRGPWAVGPIIIIIIRDAPIPVSGIGLDTSPYQSPFTEHFWINTSDDTGFWNIMETIFFNWFNEICCWLENLWLAELKEKTESKILLGVCWHVLKLCRSFPF